MLGIALGVFGLFVLWRIYRWRRWAWAHAYGYGYSHPFGGYGPWGMHHHRGWGFGWRRARWFAMRRLFEKLETSPEQEKVFRAAADELKETLREAKHDVEPARRELAAVLRAENFDPEAFGKAFDRLDEALVKVRAAASAQAGKVHAVLDDEQREALADLIERGGRWRRGGVDV